MAYAYYYWNSYTGATRIRRPQEMVDGNEGTSGNQDDYHGEGSQITFNANTCPGTDLGTISTTQCRFLTQNQDPIQMDVSTTGLSLVNYQPANTKVWSSYYTCSGVTTWSGVQNLDLLIVFDPAWNGCNWYDTDIRVTYEDSVSVTPTPATQTLSATLNAPTIDIEINASSTLSLTMEQNRVVIIGRLLEPFEYATDADAVAAYVLETP